MTPGDRARYIADKLTCFVPDEDVAMIATAIREAVEAEREACAKVVSFITVENHHLPPHNSAIFAEGVATAIAHSAAAIRARGETIPSLLVAEPNKSL